MATNNTTAHPQFGDSASFDEVFQHAFVNGLLKLLPSTRSDEEIEAFILAIPSHGLSLEHVVSGALIASKLFGPVVMHDEAIAEPVSYPIEARDIQALAAWVLVQRAYTGESDYPADADAYRAFIHGIRQQVASGRWGNPARFASTEQP